MGAFGFYKMVLAVFGVVLVVALQGVQGGGRNTGFVGGSYSGFGDGGGAGYGTYGSYGGFGGYGGGGIGFSGTGGGRLGSVHSILAGGHGANGYGR